MKRRSKTLLQAGIGFTLVSLLFAATCLFLWGKLFPFSPIILGFERKALPHVVVYIQEGNPYREFDWVDTIIPGVEEFHGLQFQSKPRIFFFGDRETYARRSICTARFCTLYNGAIMVSPWAQEEDERGEISLRIYLNHELSHSLLYQNMSLFAAMRYPKWLIEGIATYSADQRGTSIYPSKEETLQAIRLGSWLPPSLYHTDEGDRVQLEVQNPIGFAYSQFACIVDDLISRHGLETFRSYMTRLFESGDHDVVFRTAFGIDFDDYLVEFQSRIEASTDLDPPP
ncbi:MAG: hypothetical protein JW797_04315 [Bradymonadales bacterium]|nr:hypothetical protein [Bradymonadales bacterium]